MKDRRSAKRRLLPYVRSGVLDLEGRNHIVAVTDISTEGAFVTTRLAVEPGHALSLKLILPRGGQEIALPCEVVWRSERFDPDNGRPVGLAVRFRDLDSRARDLLMAFTAEAPHVEEEESYEYRLLERATLEVDELNALGREGWVLAAVVPGSRTLRAVLRRRL